ncbi:MAG: NAD-dependent epimerase [Cyclobacteriaceae bacterium]
MKKILVTGAAGFIGFHLSKRLLKDGYKVVGIDDLNDYYDVELKKKRLAQLSSNKSFSFHKAQLQDKEAIHTLFEKERPQLVMNLAAQAGVRYSIENPYAYLDSNVTGYLNILEACRHYPVEHLVYASSSSVYGGNTKMPFSVNDSVDHPVSLYAATKKANELMAHTYSHLYNVPTTGLRFFTVYGPWGRPDMALFLFADAILKGEPIKVFNNGNMRRDFTYVDDIVEGIVRLLPKPPVKNENWDAKKADPATSSAPYQVFNIGNNRPESLMRYIEILEENLGQVAKKDFLPLQPGDVPETYADVTALEDYVDFKPNTSLEDGIGEFVKWYKEYTK